MKTPTRASAALLALALLSAAPRAAAQAACPAWTDPHATTAQASPGDNLADKVRSLPSGTTLLLSPGTYKVASALRFEKDDVTLRSSTGRREDVILEGDVSGGGNPSGFTNAILVVSASGVTLADFTVRHARDHAIHAFPPAGRSIARLRLRNLHVSDCGQQLVKVNSNGGSGAGLHWADSGTVECSFIGFLDNSVMEPMSGGFYTGGIDIHGGRGWSIRGNLFRNIQREGQIMEHAVHLWSKARDCQVVGNRFEDVYRGVGLGMKTAAAGLERRYPDGKGDSPYSDMVGALVADNMIWNRAGVKLESGIEVMNALDAVLVHNTIWSAEAPFSSIEYRWPGTTAVIRNNLVSHNFRERDGAKAVLGGNVTATPAAAFAGATAGDLRLTATSTARNRGVALPPGLADRDMDGDVRDSLPDAGADEWRTAGSVRRGARGGYSPGARGGFEDGLWMLRGGGDLGGPRDGVSRADGRSLR